MLAAIWFHEVTLLALILFIMVLALAEFFTLNRQPGGLWVKIISIFAGAVILVISFLTAAGLTSPVILLADIGILLILQAYLLFRDPGKFMETWVLTTSGLVYVLVPLSLIPFICFLNGHYDYRLMFGFFILLWTYDSFAYITGILIGKHRIFPSISPKKSWEGFAGGLLFSMSMAYVVSLVYPVLSFPEWIGVAFIIVVTGTLGDFIESAMKRNAGVKDSGKFLPGHGGILDRFDSVLFSVPFVYLYLALIIK